MYKKYTNFNKNTQETYECLTKFVKKFTISHTFTKELYKYLTKYIKSIQKDKLFHNMTYRT